MAEPGAAEQRRHEYLPADGLKATYFALKARRYNANATITYASVRTTISVATKDSINPRIDARWDTPKRANATPIYRGNAFHDRLHPMMPSAQITTHNTKFTM
jgi:hypothetical protein